MNSNDLEEDVRAAFEAAQEGKEAPEAEDSTESAVSRDERGRFASKEGKTEVEAAAELQPATEQTTTPAEQKWQQDKAPQSWSAEAREKWGAIPEDIRREIVRREEAAVAGVRQLHERFAPMENFVKSIEPAFASVRELGVSPDVYFNSLAQSERVLRTADTPTKFNEVLRICDQYGIPLRDIVNKSVGKEVLSAAPQTQNVAPAQDPVLIERLNRMEQYVQNMEVKAYSSELSGFSSNKEHFEQVRYKMADLIEAGAAANLEEAYEQACWLVPEVRQQLIQGATKQNTVNRQAAAASASIPARSTVPVSVDEDDPDDVRDLVRSVFNRAASGRV